RNFVSPGFRVSRCLSRQKALPVLLIRVPPSPVHRKREHKRDGASHYCKGQNAVSELKIAARALRSGREANGTKLRLRCFILIDSIREINSGVVLSIVNFWTGSKSIEPPWGAVTWWDFYPAADLRFRDCRDHDAGGLDYPDWPGAPGTPQYLVLYQCLLTNIDIHQELVIIFRYGGRPMSRQAIFSRFIKAMGVLGSLALAACDPMTAQPAASIRPVLVTPVHYEAQVSDRSFVGTVRPRIESDLGFRVAGKVSKRLVEVGTRVEAGQPLATLDEVDLALQAEQAAAELRAATGVLAQASAAETRARELRQKGWSTDAQLDQAKAAADEARARLNRAERSVELTKNSLSYATLVADVAGVVTATLIEPGQVVTAGQTAIRLARLAEKEVVVAIPETLLTRAKSGEAQVSIWSNPDKRYIAKLRELAPSADAATRTYLAKFSMPEADDEVQLGMTATLTLSDSASDR